MGLREEIISNLRTFSELSKKYGIKSIYRSKEAHFFSNKSKTIEGIPRQRPSSRPEHSIDDPNIEDILEPVWYATSFEDSRVYCKRKYENDVKCNTYEYIPYDNSKIKNKKIVFLDLTGKKITWNGIHYLNIPLVNKIYDSILHYYKDFIYTTTETDKKDFMYVDKKLDNDFSIDEIKQAYGYKTGTRSSELYIDRFFTSELFHTIEWLNIEKELDCIIAGYYHHDIMTIEGPGNYLPAEFAITYKAAINPNYMEFMGKVDVESEPAPAPDSSTPQNDVIEMLKSAFANPKSEPSPDSPNNTPNKKQKINGGVYYTRKNENEKKNKKKNINNKKTNKRKTKRNRKSPKN